MAGFLDFLGGAASSVADTVARSEELKQMEAFQNRLRKQEMEDQIKKDKIRTQLERSSRAGTIQGSPILSPTGEALALRYDEQGNRANLEPLGIIPGVAEQTQREAEEAARKEAREDRKVAAQELRASRTGLGRSGSGPKPPSARDIAFEEDRRMAQTATGMGLKFVPSTQQLLKPGQDEDGKMTWVPASPEEYQQFTRTATAGKTPDNPIPVTSEAAIDRLDKGTYFIFQGRRGQVE
jgi:hypothetical protein